MYNEARYIDACLTSILSQSYDMTRAEILVVDGLSTDGSADIVRRRAAGDPRIKLLDNPKRILPAAINVGVAHARGKYLLKMDSHCEYYADYVAKVVETFESTSAHNVSGRFITQPGGVSRMALAIGVVQGLRFGAGTSYARQPGQARYVGDHEHVDAGWSFRRELFDKIGRVNESLVRNHDLDLSCRAYEAGLGVYYNPDIRAIYRARSNARSFARVMFNNGYYLMPLWRIRPTAFSLMHATPGIFVAVVLIGLIGGFFIKPLWWVAAAAVGAHTLVNLAISVATAASEGMWLLAYLPWLFPLTHFSYGLGTLASVLRFGLARLSREGR